MTERRERLLLVGLLLAQLILISVQVPDPAGRGSRLEGLLLRAMAPFPHLVAGISDRVGSVRRSLALRGFLLEENSRLRIEVEALRRERLRHFGMEQDLQRLRGALDYSQPELGELQAADIVYVDYVSWLQTLLLYVGDVAVELNQAVVSADGLVGRVILRSGPYAKVQVITDRAASVGAMLERSRRQGVVRGLNRGMLEMAFVPLQTDVRVGDRVITAGIDGIYARGIPVGEVTGVVPGDDLFLRIRIRPAVDFGVLDQVYVLGRQPVPDALKEPELEGGEEGDEGS